MYGINMLDKFRWNKVLRNNIDGKDMLIYKAVLTDPINGRILTLDVSTAVGEEEWTLKYKCSPVVKELVTVPFSSIENVEFLIREIGRFYGFEQNTFYSLASNFDIASLLAYDWDSYKMLNAGGYNCFRKDMEDGNGNTCVFTYTIRDTQEGDGTYVWEVKLSGKHPSGKDFTISREFDSRAESSDFIESAFWFYNMVTGNRFELPFHIIEKEYDTWRF